MQSRDERSLAYAAAVALTVLLGCWRFAPTLELGLLADDYMAVAVVNGSFSAPRSRWDAFDFANGTEADVAAVQRLGTLPWFAPANLRFAFMRPLSSALWRIDQAIAGRNLWVYHAHSIALWIVLAIVASVLYRRLLPATSAALATAVFTLDHSQQTPVQWLCNRGALYALLLGMLAFGAHLAWRERGARWGPWLSALCTALGLLFGEWALPMLAYVLAYEAVARGPLLRRALYLLPTAVPAGLFLIVRAALHYGVHGSGVYVDPGAEPLRFLGLLAHRVPVLVADILFDVRAHWWDHGSPWRDRLLTSGLFPPAVWSAMPEWRVFHVLIGLCALIVLALGYRALRRTLGEAEGRQLSFLLLGGLLALVPVAGSFPSTRLALAAMFGFAAAIGLALRQLGRMLLAAAYGGLPRFLLLFALIVAIVEVQLVSPLRDDVRGEVDAHVMAREWVLGAELDPRKVAGQHVFLLSSSEFVSTVFFAYTWHYHGRPLPRSVYPISMAPLAHDIERTADNELELRTLAGTFLNSASEDMFRSPRTPLRAGEAITLDGMTVGVMREIEGRPQILRVRFAHPLEDPSYVFLVASEAGLTRFTPPALGQTVRLPRPSAPSWYEPQRAREERRRGEPPAAFAFDPVPRFVAFEP